MDEIVKYILSGAAGATITTAAAIVIWKSLFDHALQRALEEYKAYLQKELEKHKADLQKGLEEYKAGLQKKLEEDKATWESERSRDIERLRARLSEESSARLEKYKAAVALDAAPKQAMAVERQRKSLAYLAELAGRLAEAKQRLVRAESANWRYGTGEAKTAGESFVSFLVKCRAEIPDDLVRVLDEAHAGLTSWATPGMVLLPRGEPQDDLRWLETPRSSVDRALSTLQEYIRGA